MLILTASAFAQAEQKLASNKVVIIDTTVFNNNTQGIKRLVVAERSFNVEHFYKHSLTKQIKTLEKELFSLDKQSKSFCEKSLELQKLKDELIRASEETKAEYERKYSLIVIPVIEKVREKLKEFFRVKGYAIIIDKSDILNSQTLIEGETEDITLAFIKFCNDSFEKEKPQ